MSFKRKSPAQDIDGNKTFVPYTKMIPAAIDSINLASPSFGSLFHYRPNYKIEPLKRKGRGNDKRHRELFGKSFNNIVNGERKCPFIEIDAIHSTRGVVFPLKVHAASKDSQTIQFAGLQRYDNRSEQLKEIIFELYEDLQDIIIKRMDICIDFDGELPKEVNISLKRKKRKPKKTENTTYYKTANEGKSNNYINILVYDKGEKENINFIEKVTRLEFQFKGSYWKSLKFKDMDIAVASLEKSIKSFTGMEISITKLYTKKSVKYEEGLSLKEKLDKQVADSSETLKTATDLEERLLQDLLKREGNNLSNFLNKCNNLDREANDISIKTDTVNKDELLNPILEMKKLLENKLILFHEEIKILTSIIKNKKVLPLKFLTTNEAAEFLSVDPSFLNKRKKKGIFIEDTHYYNPHGETIIRWDIDAIIGWLCGYTSDLLNQTNKIENELDELLERS